MRISSADFLENYEALLDKALSEPITITRDGRDRLVVLSVEEYDRLKCATGGYCSSRTSALNRPRPWSRQRSRPNTPISAMS